MEENQELLQCYNRGCGKKFSPEINTDDSCCHHPGSPVFHDAYKGWSCCNKRSTDFTEFLNIKGCTLSRHSNVKPIEPETRKHSATDEITEFKQAGRFAKERPPVDSPLKTLDPIVAPSVKELLKSVKVTKTDNSCEIKIGTICNHNGCNNAYQGPEASDSVCVYHPGLPIFHEGLKYWSCCEKRTTDFNVFLSQVGCKQGTHCWTSENDKSKVVNCRWDYHQTGTHVIVSIYAKNYCPDSSVVRLNPVRLYIKLVFPEKENASFEMDSELYGIVDVDASEFIMHCTKVEIKMKKAEPVYWLKLERNCLSQVRSKNQDELIKKEINVADVVKDPDLTDL